MDDDVRPEPRTVEQGERVTTAGAVERQRQRAVRGWPGEDSAEVVAAWIAAFGPGRVRACVGDLSGGECRRVPFCRDSIGDYQ